MVLRPRQLMSFLSRLSRTGCAMAHRGTWLALELPAMVVPSVMTFPERIEMAHAGTLGTLASQAMYAVSITIVKDRM